MAYKNYDKKLNKRDGERNKRKHKGFLLFMQKIGFDFEGILVMGFYLSP